MATVLFDSDNYRDVDLSRYIDEYLEWEGLSPEDFDSEEQLLEAVSDWIDGQIECDWDDFLEQCKEEKPNHCLVTGYFMSWMGPQAGGKIYKDLATAVQEILLDDSHPIFRIEDDGVMVLEETHHDAPVKGNHYEFRILTAKGEQYYAKHANDDRRMLCEALKLCGKSRNVNTRIFGI